MTTKAITPLRQRMIEDVTARKLCAGTQRGHIRSCKRFAAFLKQSPDTATLDDIRRFQTAPGRDRREHLHPQSHHDRAAVLVSRDAASIGSGRRDLSYSRTTEASAGDGHRRDQAPAGGAASLKTLVLLSLGYGCGLRASEIVRL